MKKTNNKGFSLVELIIVIAIMAILAGAIAPALIKYIDKSRKSNDVSSAKTIKTAIETALGTESVYETLTNSGTNLATVVSVIPGKQTASTEAGTGTTGVKISGCTKADGGAEIVDCAKAIGSNIGEKTPKIKYKKKIDTDGKKVDSGTGIEPTQFTAFITSGGSVYVCVGSASAALTGISSGNPTFTNCAQLAPEVCEGYQ